MKILYICTHNRCRSILSEAITNHEANGLITAKSAGSQPAGEVHPLSLKFLSEAGYSTDGLTSQSWEKLADFNPDLVVTVCDAAAGESCPLWMGNSLKVHWGLSDPSAMSGSLEQQAAAFGACIDEIKHRVDQLKTLAQKNLSRDQLKLELEQFGAH